MTENKASQALEQKTQVVTVYNLKLEDVILPDGRIVNYKQEKQVLGEVYILQGFAVLIDGKVAFSENSHQPLVYKQKKIAKKEADFYQDKLTSADTQQSITDS
jgi:hypothetical protein